MSDRKGWITTRRMKCAREHFIRWSLIIWFGFTVAVGCKESPTNPNTPGTGSGEASFQQQVKPIFGKYGCPTCHGGMAGLTVVTVATLLEGGTHGPAIIPGSPDSSLLVKKISLTPPFGDRMPRGGPYLSDGEIQVIKTWIAEGAKDN